jgi:hypothetical protein
MRSSIDAPVPEENKPAISSRWQKWPGIFLAKVKIFD